VLKKRGKTDVACLGAEKDVPLPQKDEKQEKR